MNKEVKRKLLEWAERYESPDFISEDPIQFPRRYWKQTDIEVSSFMTALLSFGRRTQIIDAANRLDMTMRGRPYEYVMSKQWECDFAESETFYRLISNQDIYRAFQFLYDVYNGTDYEDKCATLEDAVWRYREPTELIPERSTLHAFYTVASVHKYSKTVNRSSPNKKLCMFLRWMVRKNSPVDIGCWKRISPKELRIPIDTHVLRMANELGITSAKSVTAHAIESINNFCRELWPEDPCKGDFALFGYGVNHPKNRKPHEQRKA